MEDNKKIEVTTSSKVIQELNAAVSRLTQKLPADDFRKETEKIKKLTSQISGNETHIRKLAECAIGLVASALPLETMQLALIYAVNMVDASRGILYFWDGRDSYFDRLFTSEDGSEFSEDELEYIDEIAKYVHEKNRLTIDPDYDQITGLTQFQNKNGFASKNIIAAPISVECDGQEDKIGAIYLDSPNSVKTFTENDKWTVTLFASLTALSVRNIRITGSLRLAYRETVYALVKALEAKDPYTKGHSDRVAEYAERCGKRMRLGMERLQILHSAALLHDIGKIGIRENVLNKPSKLTYEEYSHIKKHPEISESILNGLDFLQEENEILSQHHERYDGKGYPHGLKGDEISVEGAIIQVSDAWDAMTSRRIYRQELDLEEALGELTSNAGTQFNPEVVEVFIAMIRSDGLVEVNEVR